MSGCTVIDVVAIVLTGACWAPVVMSLWLHVGESKTC